MSESLFSKFESSIVARVRSLAEAASDPSHDFLHFERVVKTAKQLCKEEGAQLDVVLPAAWMHDFVIVSKNDPSRKMASRLSADAAVDFLRTLNYPSSLLGPIAHAISAHSFSAGIAPESLEAKIVQDADRLDALGAIGMARCFAVAGQLNTTFYSTTDPFCERRSPDDLRFAMDHFFKKLFKISDTLQTASGKVEGARRAKFMRDYLEQLHLEIE